MTKSQAAALLGSLDAILEVRSSDPGDERELYITFKATQYSAQPRVRILIYRDNSYYVHATDPYGEFPYRLTTFQQYLDMHQRVQTFIKQAGLTNENHHGKTDQDWQREEKTAQA